MQMRSLGALWPVNSRTLGGGVRQLRGTTCRDEAVATSCEAIDAGMNLLDVAPRYGDGGPSASPPTRSAAGCRRAYGS